LRGANVAISLGDLAQARSLVDATSKYTQMGPLWLQIQAWTALARVRMAEGDRRGAGAAIRAGMTRLERYRAGIGATDLRLHASELGRDLADLGSQLAIASGAARRVLNWSERIRNSGVRLDRSEPEVVTALADLRRVAARARAVAGTEAAGEVRRAEARVSALTRQARQVGGGFSATSVGEIRDLLGERTLVEFVEAGGRLCAVTIDDDGEGLTELVETAAIRTPLDHLRFAAERIARPSSSAASLTAAIASAREVAAELRDRLVDPLQLAHPTVIVPSAALHAIPWGLVLDVPVLVAPSATAWVNAERQPARVGHSLVVAGPGLVHAASEIDRIADSTEGSVTRTIADTVAALPMAATAHFACHTRPRADSPMFSSLVLEDGELTLHDIERLDGVPATITIAACSGADAVLASGDEVVSLAGAFLALGARTVVAPLFTVSDQATSVMMGALHSALLAGSDPSTALLSIRNSAEPAVSFTAASFNCYGAG
jgi:hypothetical protein